MNGIGERSDFEVGIVVPKKKEKDGARSSSDCVEVLVMELKKVGLLVDRVQGISSYEFIRIAAPVQTLGRAAAELQIKKLTCIGVELQFEWAEAEAFVRQPDGSFFSWCERLSCFQYLIYGMVNKKRFDLTLHFNGKKIFWQPKESLLMRLESEGIVELVFPLHDDRKRKQLLRSWALNWLGFTWQPIDDIYSYFGTKIATYFAFLGMYTRWLFFPASFGLAVQIIDFGPGQIFVLSLYFIFVITWAVFFFQFWKRKNSSLLAKWGINYSLGCKDTEMGCYGPFHKEMKKKFGTDLPIGKEKLMLQREEWFAHLLKIRNNAIVIIAIIFLQLPFELAYAHLCEIINSDFINTVYKQLWQVSWILCDLHESKFLSYPEIIIIFCSSALHKTSMVWDDCYLFISYPILYQDWGQIINHAD